jgi:hypothetical protein
LNQQRFGSSRQTPGRAQNSNLPDEVQLYRQKKRRANPEQFKPWSRPLYNRGRSDPRFTRGKENYRPRQQGQLNLPPPNRPGASGAGASNRPSRRSSAGSRPSRTNGQSSGSRPSSTNTQSSESEKDEPSVPPSMRDDREN